MHCGFCNAACPTYQLSGDEREGPRGRIYLIKQTLEGAPASSVTQGHLDRCLTCRACEITCPSGVAYGRLLDIGRSTVEQQVRRSFFEAFKRRFLCATLPYPTRFAVAMQLAQLGKVFLPKRLRSKIPGKPRVKIAQAVSFHHRQILLLDGCVQPSLAPNVNTAASKVLSKLGIASIKPAKNGCCGAISYHLSDQHAALAFMRANIDVWLLYLDQGVEAIVSTASGCGLMVKEYAAIFQHDPLYRDKARRISAACKDIVEIIAAEDLTIIKAKVTGKLAFQSPCTLQHGQRLNGAVESLLKKLGFELTPVSHSHLCCGSAGVYSLLQPQLAERLLQNKLAALEGGQPDIIATANIGCQIHLQSKASKPVSHWIELLADESS